MNQKHLLLILSFALVVTSCKKTTEAAAENKITIFADSLIQAAVDSSRIAGAAVLVHQNGETLLKKTYGYASLELQVPVPEEASFEIGSVTKQFTAAAILKLAEEGKLSLQDDFRDYVPYDTGGRDIPISALLDHTSGIPSYTEIPEFWEMSMRTYPRDSLLRLVEKEPFLFEPGERMIYNNTAYFILGLIIEKVSGKPYEEYLKETIFDPLGMDNTYYCTTSEIVPGKVYGYNYTEEGLMQKPYLDHTWPYAAGSLCSSTSDQLKWLKAVHEGGFFSDSLYESLIEPARLNDGTQLRYAKGLSVFKDYGQLRIGHGGGINGFLSQTLYYPEEKLYIISLVNTTGPVGAGYLANELSWQLLEKEKYASQTPEVVAETLAGTYKGQVRGRVLELEVELRPEGLVVGEAGRVEKDTLSVYVGNDTWMDRNEILKFTDTGIEIDQVSGYYILEKQ